LAVRRESVNWSADVVCGSAWLVVLACDMDDYRQFVEPLCMIPGICTLHLNRTRKEVMLRACIPLLR
jgi:hypothetical protein